MSALHGKGVGAKSFEDLQDRVKHRGSEGTNGRVVAESHAEIAIHGSRVESDGVTIAKGLESLLILGAPGTAGQRGGSRSMGRGAAVGGKHLGHHNATSRSSRGSRHG